MEINIKRKGLRLPILNRCGQVCFSCNQIAGFFDHECVCKESINTLDFLQGDNERRSRGLWLVVASFASHPIKYQNSLIIDISGRLGEASRVSSNQIAGFFDHHYFAEESIDIFFLLGDKGKVAPVATTVG